MKKRRVYESRGVNVNKVQFVFQMDTDPLIARFIPKTSQDLDKLTTVDDVDRTVKSIQDRLAEITGIKWAHDNADPGAGYSFIPDEQALAKKIETAF